MKLSFRTQDSPDVNLTPMIDVVFLLLLFFMVSTSFIKESSMKVDLPEANQQAVIDVKVKPIDILIHADGRFEISETILPAPTAEELKQLLQQQVGEQVDPHIIISADAIAQYQDIVTAMDVVQQLGYQRLSLATRQTQQ